MVVILVGGLKMTPIIQKNLFRVVTISKSWNFHKKVLFSHGLRANRAKFLDIT